MPFAIERYTKEVARLYGVLDKRLADREYIAGEISIADIACYPWVVPHRAHGQEMTEHPNVGRWFESITTRPATKRVYDGVEDVYVRPTVLSPSARRVLFERDAATTSSAGDATFHL